MNPIDRMMHAEGLSVSSDNVEALAEEIGGLVTPTYANPEAGAILLDLADFIGDLGGVFTDKALAEIANAYLEGMLNGAQFRHGDDVRQAARAMTPILARSINRRS